MFIKKVVPFVLLILFLNGCSRWDDAGSPSGPTTSTLARFSFVPAIKNTTVGQFTVDINIDNAQDVYSGNVYITYDPAKINYVSVSAVDVAMDKLIPNSGSGFIEIGFTKLGTTGFTGNGTLLRFTFTALSTGITSASMDIANTGLKNSSNQLLGFTIGGPVNINIS